MLLKPEGVLTCVEKGKKIKITTKHVVLLILPKNRCLYFAMKRIQKNE
jgi:hypothetical protein